MKRDNRKYRHSYNETRQGVIYFDNDDDARPDPDLNDKDSGGKHATAAAGNDDKSTWPMQFASFGSGSSGNCAYLGNSRQGILIDAGVDMTHVFHDLAQNGISPSMVKGIILTHDHSDHVRYVYRIVRQYKHIHIYCTPKLMNGLLRHHNISRRVKDYQEPIFKEIPFHLAGMTITAFETSHDATDNMGFMIEGGGHRFVVGTDMGMITPRADYYMRQAEYLMIESNYDRVMLDEGHCRERAPRQQDGGPVCGSNLQPRSEICVSVPLEQRQQHARDCPEHHARCPRGQRCHGGRRQLCSRPARPRRAALCSASLRDQHVVCVITQLKWKNHSLERGHPAARPVTCRRRGRRS